MDWADALILKIFLEEMKKVISKPGRLVAFVGEQEDDLSFISFLEAAKMSFPDKKVAYIGVNKRDFDLLTRQIGRQKVHNVYQENDLKYGYDFAFFDDYKINEDWLKACSDLYSIKQRAEKENMTVMINIHLSCVSKRRNHEMGILHRYIDQKSIIFAPPAITRKQLTFELKLNQA